MTTVILSQIFGDVNENYFAPTIVTLSNGTEVEVRNRIPQEEKFELMQTIINACAEEEGFFNPLKLNIVTMVETVKYYTNIDCSDYEDVFHLYDVLKSNKVFDDVLPLTEFNDVINWSYECAETITKYSNSARGIINAIQQNREADNLVKDFQGIMENAKQDPELKSFIENYMPSLVQN